MTAPMTRVWLRLALLLAGGAGVLAATALPARAATISNYEVKHKCLDTWGAGERKQLYAGRCTGDVNQRFNVWSTDTIYFVIEQNGFCLMPHMLAKGAYVTMTRCSEADRKFDIKRRFIYWTKNSSGRGGFTFKPQGEGNQAGVYCLNLVGGRGHDRTAQPYQQDVVVWPCSGGGIVKNDEWALGP